MIAMIVGVVGAASAVVLYFIGRRFTAHNRFYPEEIVGLPIDSRERLKVVESQGFARGCFLHNCIWRAATVTIIILYFVLR